MIAHLPLNKTIGISKFLINKGEDSFKPERFQVEVSTSSERSEKFDSTP